MEHDDLRLLLDKFEAGETTLAEERLLARALKQQEDHHAWKTAFALFETEKNTTHPLIPLPVSKPIPMWAPGLAATAAALLLLSLLFSIPRPSTSSPAAVPADDVPRSRRSAVARMVDLHQNPATASLPARVEELSHVLATDPSANVRIAAVRALAHTKNPAHAGLVLMRHYPDESDDLVKLFILKQMWRLDQPTARREVQRLIQSESSSEALVKLAGSMI